MKDFNNITFVRWGNLNPRKHKEGRLSDDDDKRGFHTAPCYKGIYAFPEGMIEPFLLGGVKPVNGKVQNRYFFLKNDDGEKILVDDFYEKDEDGWLTDKVKPQYMKLLKEKNIRKRDVSGEFIRYKDDEENGEWYMTYNTNKHTFKYNGRIWHHLDVDKKDILSKKGSWILTEYNVYIKALKRYICKERFKCYMDYRKSEVVNGNPHSFPSFYARDHYEVFIEKIK